MTWEREDEEEFDDELDEDALDEDRQSSAPAVTIEISGLSLYTRHGVHEAERELGQRLVFDVSFELDECDATVTDRVEDTINYGEVCEQVALVRAEAEVADLAQASFQTSTDTSSTGSGIGGSGLAALTRTDSAPKRSISRSATAVQSRSSVLYERSCAARATCSQTSP